MELRTTPVRYPGVGCLVEIMLGNKPQVAWVLEEQGTKLRLYTLARREVKLAQSRILPWAGPSYDGDTPKSTVLDILQAHHDHRERVEATIDPMELWELSQGELESASLEWFAELLWEAPDSEGLAALGRSLLACKTHFKFRPPIFDVHPADKVEARLLELAKAKERERLAEAGHAFLASLWHSRVDGSGKHPEVPEDIADALREILMKRIAFPDDSETARVWNDLIKGLPENPHMALLLAESWGLVGQHHNFHYDQAGYEPGDAWSARHEQEIQAVRSRVEAEQGAPLPVPFVSVDSATTRDIDDAMHVERTETGYRLKLALACPALHFDFAGSLGRDVADRATSIYLPEGDSHMLPESLGTDFFSLHQGQVRPGVVMDMELDARSELLSLVPAFSWVRVLRNSNYVEAEALLEGRGGAEIGESIGPVMETGYELAQLLRQRRIERGAVIIDRPEPDIRIQEVDGRTRVSMEHKEACPGSQLMVSECMVLANTAMASWAREADLPLLHRTQDVAIPKEYAGVWTAPEDIHSVVKVLGASLLEAAPKPHATLGAKAYAPVSSPLRRYPDLINMAQILARLTGHGIERTRDELAAMLPDVSSRLEAAGRIQRFRPRFWKLLYIKQQGDAARWPAVVVEDSGRFVTLAMPREQLYVRGPRNLFSDKLLPGQVFSLRLGKIDPLKNEIYILEAWED